MMPRAGGVYVFLREAYGPAVGFLFGWTLFLVVQTGTIAAVAIAFAKFLGVFAPSVSADNYLVAPISITRGYAVSLSTEQVTAIALIALLTLHEHARIAIGKLVQNRFTFTKTAALVGVVVIGVIFGWKPNCAALAAHWWNAAGNGWNPQMAQPGLESPGVSRSRLLFGKAMVGPLFAQTAWTNVTFIGSEVRDPGRNLSRALLRLRHRGRALRPRQRCLRRLAFASANSNAPQNRVAVAMMAEFSERLACWVCSRDYDFHLRLQQRPYPGRRACLLRHGPRQFVFSQGRERPIVFTFPQLGAGRPGNLDRALDFATNSD